MEQTLDKGTHGFFGSLLTRLHSYQRPKTPLTSQHGGPVQDLLQGRSTRISTHYIQDEGDNRSRYASLAALPNMSSRDSSPHRLHQSSLANLSLPKVPQSAYQSRKASQQNKNSPFSWARRMSSTARPLTPTEPSATHASLRATIKYDKGVWSNKNEHHPKHPNHRKSFLPEFDFQIDHDPPSPDRNTVASLDRPFIQAPLYRRGDEDDPIDDADSYPTSISVMSLVPAEESPALDLEDVFTWDAVDYMRDSHLRLFSHEILAENWNHSNRSSMHPGPLAQEVHSFSLENSKTLPRSPRKTPPLKLRLRDSPPASPDIRKTGHILIYTSAPASRIRHAFEDSSPKDVEASSYPNISDRTDSIRQCAGDNREAPSLNVSFHDTTPESNVSPHPNPMQPRPYTSSISSASTEDTLGSFINASRSIPYWPTPPSSHPRPLASQELLEKKSKIPAPSFLQPSLVRPLTPSSGFRCVSYGSPTSLHDSQNSPVYMSDVPSPPSSSAPIIELTVGIHGMPSPPLTGSPGPSITFSPILHHPMDNVDEAYEGEMQLFILKSDGTRYKVHLMQSSTTPLTILVSTLSSALILPDSVSSTVQDLSRFLKEHGDMTIALNPHMDHLSQHTIPNLGLLVRISAIQEGNKAVKTILSLPGVFGDEDEATICSFALSMPTTFKDVRKAMLAAWVGVS